MNEVMSFEECYNTYYSKVYYHVRQHVNNDQDAEDLVDVIFMAAYKHYDNYEAIDVPYTEAIPIDYEGVMGVPKTFMDKYCPEQFEIIGIAEGDSGKELGLRPFPRELKVLNKSLRDGQLYYIDANGIPQKPYARILIRKRTQQ